MTRATEKTLVTPEMAENLLGTMQNNRTLNRNKTNSYEADMRNGTFNCAMPISIGVSGHLIDGQHRLTAIKETGIPQYLYVDVDVADDTVFDTGLTRNKSQSAYMRGQISKDLSRADIYSLYRSYTDSKYGVSVTKNFVEQHFVDFASLWGDQMLDAARISRLGNGSHGRRVCNRGPVAAALFAGIVNGYDVSRLETFAIAANSGIYDSPQDITAIRFRNVFFSSEKKSGGMTYLSVTAMAEKAIFDFMRKVKRKTNYSLPSYEEAKKGHILIDSCRAEVDFKEVSKYDAV